MHVPTPTTKQALLVLGAGRNQVPAIQAAKRMGLRVLAIDPSSNAPGFAFSDASCVLDLADRAECLRVARDFRVDGIITVAAEYPIPTLGFLCESLGLLGITQAAAALSTNKRLMRRALAQAGLPQPRYHHVSSADAAVAAVHALGKKSIIKPVVANGKKGITSLAAGPSNEDISRAFVRAREFTREDGVLVEEYLDGPEFSVEAITFRGHTQVVAITEKFTSGDPYFVELGHLQPARLSHDSAEALANAAVASATAIGIDHSASHTEIRLTDAGPRVIEIGARLGGGFITSHLVPLSTGIDMVGQTITLALGGDPRVEPMASPAAAIWFISARAGPVASIDGVSNCFSCQGINDVAIYVTCGDVIGPLIDNRHRAGHVIGTAATPAAAIELVRKAAAVIQVRTLVNN